MALIDEVKKELQKYAGSYETDENGFHKDTLAVIEQLQDKNKRLKEALWHAQDFCKCLNKSKKVRYDMLRVLLKCIDQVLKEQGE